jgi:hypothetical protein
MRGVIADLDNDWAITGDEIDSFLRTHDAAVGTS